MLPKKNLKSVKINDTPYGNAERIGNTLNILKGGTEFPKAVNYEDIDISFKEFVVEDIAKQMKTALFPVYTLYSNQRFSEYSQTWEHTDNDGNLIMDFITINRDSDPKSGNNQGGYWNIPGNRKYPMLIRDVLDDNGTESYEVFSMKQPFCVDLSYRINVMTITYENINRFNAIINDLFKSRQHYIRPNGHAMPIVVDSINDQTEYGVQDKRFFVQSVTVNVMAYIINEEDYSIQRFPKRIIVSGIGDSRRPKPTVDIEEDEGNGVRNKKLDVTMSFPPYEEYVTFTIDTDMNIETINTDNIRNYRISVNGTPYFVRKGFKAKENDEIKVKISKYDITESSTMTFNGYDPNETYIERYAPEDVREEQTKSESIIVE